MKPETLASLEARLKGAADTGEPETPRPVGNNPQREPVGQKRPEDMTADELRAAIKGFSRSDFGLT